MGYTRDENGLFMRGRLIEPLTAEHEAYGETLYLGKIEIMRLSGTADTLPAAPGPFELLPDEAYNLQHRDFDLVSRNAGPLFMLGEQIIHPTQVSTGADYGVYLQFLARRGSSEIPLCAALPRGLEITGLDPADIIGVHTYCRDEVLEVLDARYLTRLPKAPAAEQG